MGLIVCTQNMSAEAAAYAMPPGRVLREEPGRLTTFACTRLIRGNYGGGAEGDGGGTRAGAVSVFLPLRGAVAGLGRAVVSR